MVRGDAPSRWVSSKWDDGELTGFPLKRAPGRWWPNTARSLPAPSTCSFPALGSRRARSLLAEYSLCNDLDTINDAAAGSGRRGEAMLR